MNNQPDLQKFNIDQETYLKFNPPWPDPVHQLRRKEAMAIVAALLTGRPLLIEGPPGSGKTQMAAAAAIALDRELISYVVNSDTRPEDLLWQYNALQRLNDAQAQALKETEQYLSKGPLWLAYDNGEREMDLPSAIEPYKPESGGNQGKVILIDEIDKADRSVPNSLLEVFGHRRFYCPHVQRHIGAHHSEANGPLPLIIITSNREQQLPPAFVRRCLILRIELPSDKDAFSDLLAKRAKMHYGTKVLTIAQYRKIAETLWDIRDGSGLPEEMQPGQAEYLDLVRAISEAFSSKLNDQHGKPLTFDQLLDELRPLAFDKAKSSTA